MEATQWNSIGFSPHGHVRYQYEVTVSDDGKTCAIKATSDLDEDGDPESHSIAVFIGKGDNYSKPTEFGDDF